MKILLASILLQSLLQSQSVGTLASAGRMVKSRSAHTATLLLDGRVLFTGGTCANACEKSMEIFDPSTGTSSELGTMLYGRSEHAAVLLADGRVLISGGAPISEIFDPSTGKSEAFPTQIWNGAKQKAFRLADGRVAFGCTGASIEFVDLARGLVESISYLGAPFSACIDAVMLPDGRIFVVNSSLHYSAYDPASRSWQFLHGNRQTAHDVYEGFSASALTNGNIAIAGGTGAFYVYRDSLDLFEIFNPQQDQSLSEPLSRTRFDHSACLSPDGLILSGGKSGSTFVQPGYVAFQTTPLNTIEIREAANGRPAGLLHMSSHRVGHTCTLLNDGSVLLAGGNSNPAMERYSPINRWPELSIAAAVPIRGEALELYVSGPLHSSPFAPLVSVNGINAEVLYFAPNQINIRIPSSISKAESLSVQFTYLDRHSNVHSVSLR